MIRPATPEDIPRIVDLGRKNHAARGGRNFDANAAAPIVGRIIQHGAVFVTDGGMIGGVPDPFWAAPTEKRLTELFWYAEDGSGLALLRRLQQHAHEAGMPLRISAARPSRAFERMGFRATDTVYEG